MPTFNYRRRHTVSVNVGGTPMGSDFPVRVQSMTNTSTDDIDASVAQCRRLADAGAEYVRLTAQGVREAEAIGQIRTLLRNQGCTTPLVADIHFNPRAAFAAAQVTDKVRINPGNFVDPARQFKSLSYTDEEYAAELQRIHDALVPFIDVCRQHGTAVRLGVNHGSLSDRIMSRYGNTAAGMVESVMEFLRVFVAEGFLNVVISMKASNVVVMVEAVRRLVRAMDAENMHFPLHLGVTEAGFGDDGRVKSAVGIGALMSEGLGDTIRVSLSEAPEAEIPVARKLVEYITSRTGHAHIDGALSPSYDAVSPSRRASSEAGGLVGGHRQPVVVASCRPGDVPQKAKPDFYFSTSGEGDGGANRYIVPFAAYTGAEGTYPLLRLDEWTDNCQAAIKWVAVKADTPVANLEFLKDRNDVVLVVDAANVNIPGSWQSLLHSMSAAGISCPAVPRASYADTTDTEWLQVKAGADFGTVLLNGFADGIWLDAPDYADAESLVGIEFAILQSARLRMSKTEFISCPSCGRTMFDLMSTVERVKEATAHLTHLKIGVMGCVVNGPGEAKEADVGIAGGKNGGILFMRGEPPVTIHGDAEALYNALMEKVNQLCAG